MRIDHNVFSRAEEPTEDINSHLFLMNKKRLLSAIIIIK
jgi:hypothetical protein